MSLAGAVRWTLSSRIFTSIVSVGAPGMANSTISLSFAASAYATVLGATLFRYSGILATSLAVSKVGFSILTTGTDSMLLSPTLAGDKICRGAPLAAVQPAVVP